MKRQRWSESQEKILKENLGKITLKEIGKILGKTELAVKLYIHRNHIVYRPSVKRNLVLELFRIKLINPEYFNVTTAFLHAVISTKYGFGNYTGGRKAPQIKSIYV